jgi:hypothetical protein
VGEHSTEFWFEIPRGKPVAEKVEYDNSNLNDELPTLAACEPSIFFAT